MKRKLPLTVLLSLSAISPQALALGLGDVEVRSTLDAPLRAAIPLTDSAGLEAGLLNVSLADEAAFEAAGLSRTPLAASVEMSIRRRQGRLVLELVTDRAVREPWLDLLLRFDWPGGRQLREVTLLLDPPNYDEMPALIGTSATQRLATVSPPPATPRSMAVPPRASERTGAADPARVRRGDTLWAVAGRLRPDSGISMNQMMVALVEANPEAFPSGNINAMRAGVTLVVPSREAIAARRSAEAARIVQAMNQAWANRGSGLPARVPLDGGAGGDTAVASRDAAAALDEDEPVVAEAVRNETASIGEADGRMTSPRLTLLTEAQAAEGVEDEGAAAGPFEEGADGEPPRGGAPAPTEVAQAPTGAGMPREQPDRETPTGLSGEGELNRDERLLRLERRWQESRDALSAVQAERDALAGELDEVRSELGELRDQLASLTAGSEAVEEVEAGGVMAPGRAGETPSEAPWWGALYRGGTDRTLMLGGAGLAALLALWALVRRRRRREETPAEVFGELQVVGPQGGRNDAGERAATATASEPSAEASVRASMPQAEAISEADIFIAYGRFDQARELLEASLDREPGRDDLRLKLLGVMLEQGDRPAAELEAERLGASADPVVREEAGRLLGRRDGDAASPVAGERAVFSAPDERPPRRFDEPAETMVEPPLAAAGAPEEQMDPAREAPASPPVAAGTEANDELSRYRPPELASAAGDRVSSSSPASPSSARAGGDAEPREAPTSVAAEADEGKRDIIDYRPPPLQRDTAPREETPLQPSIEFSPVRGGEAPPAGSGGERWDIEEVAFPSSDGDNASDSSAAASVGTLSEARRLLDTGQASRARALLEDLVEASADPEARKQARELLERHQT